MIKVSTDEPCENIGRKKAAAPAIVKGRKRVSDKSLRQLKIKRGSADTDGSTLVQQAVESLRARILSSGATNPFLGSEEQLIAALGISRPTFRQAARLLEHEQLLKSKRGIGGGFFAQPPSTEAVSRFTSVFLNARGTTLRQLLDATSPVMIEAAQLLAQNPDAKVRRQLLEFLEERSRAPDRAPADLKSRKRGVPEFEQVLGELCGNPAMALMINVMHDLVLDARQAGNLEASAERAAAYATFTRKLASVVADGDSDMAALITRRHFQDVRSWLSNENSPEAIE